MSKVRLGDVAKEHKETCKGDKSDYPIVGLEHLEPECITLSQWSESTDNTFSKVFRKGHVLFGRRRAYLKKAAVAPFDGICSGDITVIEAIPGRIIPELLPFVIQNDALFDFAVGRSAGSLSPRVKWEHLKNYEFELPASEEEQRKLADVLWSIEQTRKSYNSLLRATDELVKSQFIELFGQVNSSFFPVKKLKECATIKHGFAFKGEFFSYNDNRIVLVTPGNFKIGGGFQENECRFYSGTYLDEYVLAPGSLIVTMTDLSKEADTLGYAAIIPENSSRVYLHNQRIGLVELSSELSKSFVFHYMRTDEYRRRIVATATGSTVHHTSPNRILDSDIMVPPLSLQMTFEKFAQQLDKSKFELEQALSELTLTYKRILAENLG